MSITIPGSAGEIALKLLTDVIFLGGAASFLTWLVLQALPQAGENWRRVISNTIPIVIVLILVPLGAWRHWLNYTDDLFLNALIGAFGIGWGKQWLYSLGKAGAAAVNKARGVANPPGS